MIKEDSSFKDRIENEEAELINLKMN
ncbi:hypothetical protein LNTAR_25385 [Lentisphaera araneosa HTCC2155]|uniref:Uncharacterized protein n=1 Tax=Lentisphaera araneosa HTCC2155 TaxID=313628 RepID=A6DSB9_9BACT|nr:hypothetical protein LNTAR_25385 [Lentisphaera araneosa HTCC2155]